MRGRGPRGAREGASSLGVPPERRFSRLDQALDAVPCDAVIVATSADRHVEPCELALSRGLGVLVEKPFAQSLDEAIRLVEIGETAGAPIVVAQNYRYMRPHRAARRLVRGGVLGRVGMAVCHYYNVPRHLGSHATMPHGALWAIGVHHIDALAYVLGQKVTGVIADAFAVPWGESPGASIEAMLTLEGGARATYTASYESSGHEFFERGQEFYERFVGERGTLHVYHRWLILCQRGQAPPAGSPRPPDRERGGDPARPALARVARGGGAGIERPRQPADDGGGGGLRQIVERAPLGQPPGSTRELRRRSDRPGRRPYQAERRREGANDPDRKSPPPIGS